jgi:glycosyltransferase involved in cell wall biosynthesis
MRLVTLPAIRFKSVETLTNSALSSLHAMGSKGQDVVIMFNSANAVYLPLLRARRLPVAVHVDGLEWRRSKWTGAGERFYRSAESLAVRWADALIADARGIGDYYRDEFGAQTEFIPYGAPQLSDLPADRLQDLQLESKKFHLLVARFEPENNVDLILRGYLRSSAKMPIVVVGAAPYSDDYTTEIRSLAARDSRVRLIGPIWDQNLLDQLYCHARLYLHGHSVGGTNPSLLRAMGAGTAVGAFGVVFNQEVLGPDAWLFRDPAEVAALIEQAERAPQQAEEYGESLQRRTAEKYQWDDVAHRYEQLSYALAGGWSRRGEVSGRRLDSPEWNPGSNQLATRAPNGDVEA